jgi:hypothetical protein
LAELAALPAANAAVRGEARADLGLLSALWQAHWIGDWALVGQGPRLPALALAGLVLALGLVPWRRPAARRLVGLWGLSALGLTAALTLLGNDMHPRYLVAVAPLLLVPLGAGAADRPRLGALVLGLLALGLAAALVHSATPGSPGHDDPRAAAEFFAEELGPDGKVLAWSYARRFDLEYYFRRAAGAPALVTLPEEADLDAVLSRLPAERELGLNVWYGQRADYRGLLDCVLSHGGGEPPEVRDVAGMSNRVYGDRRPLPPARPMAARLALGELAEVGSLPAAEAGRAACLPVALRLDRPTADDAQVAVIVGDGAGGELLHVDAVLADAAQRTSREAPAGSTLRAFPVLRLPEGSPPGSYPVALRVYDAGRMGGYTFDDGSVDLPLGSWQVVADEP